MGIQKHSSTVPVLSNMASGRKGQVSWTWGRLKGLRQGPPVSVQAIIGKATEQGEQGLLWLLSSLSLKGQYSTRVEPNIYLLLGMMGLSFLLFSIE